MHSTPFQQQVQQLLHWFIVVKSEQLQGVIWPQEWPISTMSSISINLYMFTASFKKQATKTQEGLNSAMNSMQKQNAQLSQQITEANTTMKYAAPVLSAMGNQEAEKIAKGLDFANKNMVPILNETNKAIAQGTQLANQGLQKGTNFLNSQLSKVENIVDSQLDEVTKSMDQTKAQIEKMLVVPKADLNSLKSIGPSLGMGLGAGAMAFETPTESGDSKIQQNQQRAVPGSRQSVQAVQETPTDLGVEDTKQKQRQSQVKTEPDGKANDRAMSNQALKGSLQKLEAKNQQGPQNYVSYVQNKFKQYIKTITGKQVNSRIEYLCMLTNLLKESKDSNLLQQVKEKLTANAIVCAQQERRITSQIYITNYFYQILEFVLEYLSIVETVFQQLKIRFRSSSKSFQILQNYLNGLIVQLDYFETYSFVKPQQPTLSLIYTDKARQYDKKPKLNLNQDAQTDIANPPCKFQPKFCDAMENLQDKLEQSMIGMNSLKQLIRCEMREKLNTCYQENRGKIEDHLLQVQGQRNIAFQQIEKFYNQFVKYRQLYSQNVELVFNNDFPKQDLYDEEYKLFCMTAVLYKGYFAQMIKQQQQFGLFTTYMIREIQGFDLNRLEVMRQTMQKLSEESAKYLTAFHGFDKLFNDQQIIRQAQQAFSIQNLISPDQIEIIRKYTRLPKAQEMTTEVYCGFAANFKIPEILSSKEANPLVLKEFNLLRDVAWERSLSFGRDLIPSKCVVTVDGFMLFYDQDLKAQGEQPVQANYSICAREVKFKELKKEDLYELVVRTKGKVFDRNKRMAIRFNEVLDQESLRLLLEQFK